MTTTRYLDAEEVSELVEASRSGDQLAWRRLVDSLSPLVWSVTRSFGLPHHDAVDVSQTTWMQFARHVGSLDDPRKAPGWLATTARRECLRLAGTQRREPVTKDSVFERMPGGERPEARVEAQAESALIWESVESLGDPCRSLVRMFLAEPVPSYETVALALGISTNAVGPKRSRCLAALRTVLQTRLDLSDGDAQ